MQSNESVMLANLRMLEFVAMKLGEIRNNVVFLGGCTTDLFITDPEFPDVRYTLDVDCIVGCYFFESISPIRKEINSIWVQEIIV